MARFIVADGRLRHAGAASEPGGVVTNGMSLYARSGQNANSALLIGVSEADFSSDHPLAGVAFQRALEQKAFALGGNNYRAPCQLAGDFVKGQASVALGGVAPTYLPGVTLCGLDALLPSRLSHVLRTAIPALGRRLRGFDRPDALLTGVESRSSSPVRILRGEDFQSPLRGLYPCGEGAGYAGGIISAAVDGMRVAEEIIRTPLNRPQKCFARMIPEGKRRYLTPKSHGSPYEQAAFGWAAQGSLLAPSPLD